MADAKQTITNQNASEEGVLCESCGALMAVEAGQLRLRCPFCDGASVVNRPASPSRPRPIFVLAFTVDRDEATEAVRKWIARQRMPPIGLRGRAAERITGVYVPVYLYSATAHSEYQASVGEAVGEVRTHRNAQGSGSLPRSGTIEYRELRGKHVAYLADVVVTASRGVANEELQGVEPFDLTQLRRYSPALIAGWSAEEASRLPEECLRLARKEGEEAVRKELYDFMPGDDVTELKHTTVFEEESIELTLAPVWVVAFRYRRGKPPLRMLVNGQTGKVSGVLPFAWGKLGWLVVSLLLATLGVLAALRVFIR